MKIKKARNEIPHSPGSCPNDAGDEGNWSHQKSTLKEKDATDSISYAVYRGIISDGTFRYSDDALPDLWDVVKGNGGVCLEFAKLMRKALLVAGVPESSLVVRNVVSPKVCDTWLGGTGKTVLSAFKENAAGEGYTWLNQGVCGVNTADNGWRYYDLTGPGVGTWETGSGGWATPSQPNVPGANNLWFEALPVTAGPVIKLFTEQYGIWSPPSNAPHDADGFDFLNGPDAQIKITDFGPWIGNQIPVTYRTEGVKDVGVEVLATVYLKTGTEWVAISKQTQQIAQKWDNQQTLTFSLVGYSGGSFYVSVSIRDANGGSHEDDWVANVAGPEVKP